MLTEAGAFLAIWHDLEEKGKREWERWHTYEHMPERIGIPGFLAGRRFMNDSERDQCCFTIYEGIELSVFKSAPYLERLNNPTPWTRKNAPTFKKQRFTNSPQRGWKHIGESTPFDQRHDHRHEGHLPSEWNIEVLREDAQVNLRNRDN